MRVEQESGRLPGFADLDTSPGRRDVLRVAGASLALAAAGCDIGPEEWGHPLHARARGVPQEDASYATVLDLDGVARGVLVRTRAGHPIKIEGNPDHPGSLGATDVFLESAVLSLHDPERSRHLRRDGLVARQATAAQAIDTLHGEGLRILTGPTTSPSLARLVASVQPEARWHQWAPLDERNARDGATLAFGQAVTPLPDLAAARCVLSLGGGLLDAGPAQLVQARGWAEARRAGTPPTLIVAESTPSLTGLKADRRLALTPHGVEMLARGVAAELGLAVQGAHPEAARIAAALRRAAPAALVQAARDQPPVVHALAHAMNQALGAPVRLLPPSQPEAASLHDLLRDMQAGAVPRLLVLDLDPVRDVPGFAALLARVPASLHAGLHANATALACGWHIPLAHPLESWGDSRAPDGTAAIRQPACAPRVEAALSAEDILAALTGEAGGEAAIRATWLALDDAAWRAALEQGVIAGSAPAPLALQASFEAGSPPVAPPGLTASFAPDPHLWDGRFATEAWLQELPRPITRQAWGSAALIAPADAARLGIVDGGAAEITLRGRSATLPVIVLPGQAQGVVTLPLGSEGAARLRPLDSPWSAEGVTLRPAGRAQVLRIGWLHGEAPRCRHSPRSIRPGCGRGGAGAWRSTSMPASAATPAPSPARRRTTSPWSARRRWRAGGRCTGCAWTCTRTAKAAAPSSPCPACIARRRPARSPVPSTPRCTTRKG
jgi:molybdopterin-containing oxidoreductase family iron-sulfur binding subunit